MRKIKRIVKKSWLLVLVFFSMAFFISMVFSPIVDRTLINKSQDSIFTREVKFLSISNEEDGVEREIVNQASKIKGSVLRKTVKDEKGYYLNGIYFNEKVNQEIPTVKGRFFKAEDFLKQSNNVVIGEKIYNSLENKEVFKYRGSEYKVIGVIDSKKTYGVMDNEIFMDINVALSYDFFEKSSNFYSYDTLNSNVDKNALNIKREVSGKYPKSHVSDYDVKGGDNEFLYQMNLYGFFVTLLVCLIVVLSSCIINVSSYWIDKEKRNIGIRKLSGATNIRIIKEIVIQYELSALIATLTAFSLYRGINSTGFFEILSTTETTSYGMVITFSGILLVVLTIGLLLSLIPIIKLLRLDVNTIIRGN